MHRKSLLAGLILCALASPLQGAVIAHALPAPAGATEGIVLDLETGNYVITYEAGSEYTPRGMYRTIYTPATKINPSVKSHFREMERPAAIAYAYKVKNGKDSKQNLGGILMVTISHAYPGLVGPRGWNGSIITNVDGPGFRIGWHYSGSEDLGGVTPGVSLGGLEFKSSDLPGIGIMQLMGATPIQAYAGHGPREEISDQITELDRNDFVPRFVALPKIPVPSPFDAAAVLTSLRKHVKDDFVKMQLIEPEFASKLDLGFASAIETAKLGSTEGLRIELKALRRMLKGFGETEADEHAAKKKDDSDDHEDKAKTGDWPHPIAKLAARVLDFDIKYIEKRIEPSHGRKPLPTPTPSPTPSPEPVPPRG